MRENAFKSFIRRSLFPDGAVRRIAFGPLRGMRYRVSPITGMETWHSAHERPMQNAFARLVGAGDVVVDVGTNWGGHALHLSLLVGEAGRVLAVEPSPGVIREAQWHFKENGRNNIELLDVALADVPGRAFFEETQLSTTGRLGAASSGHPGVEVEVTTLDEVLAKRKISKLSLVKIDVEGAESRVLAGATATLARLRPNLIVELHTPEQDLAVARLLRDAGYTLRRLDGTPIAHPDQGWPDREGVWGMILATPN